MFITGYADYAELSEEFADEIVLKKPFTTDQLALAVCKAMGCWMEIKDDTTEAHIKMAGESFFVPKTSAAGTATLVAYAWDGSVGTHGTVLQLT